MLQNAPENLQGFGIPRATKKPEPPQTSDESMEEEVKRELLRAIGRRKIVHVDMDAFYASVEQRDRPELRGKPVVVAHRGPRSVVCAASYEVRRFGVRSAMPALRAEKLCPDAIFVPPDFARYREVSRQIHAIFKRHSDRIEPLSLDEAYLDVTQSKSGLGSATEIAEAIRRAIRDELSLTASAGVAPNKFLAKMASEENKPDGLFVLRPEQVLDFLAPQPVGRIPGVGEVTEGRLNALGIRKIDDLRQTPASTLEAHFGRWGARLHELAYGIDAREVVSDRPNKQISSETTFDDDLLLHELGPHLEALASKVFRAYEREESRIARTVTLKLKTRDFRTLTRSETPPFPPESFEEFLSLATGLLERVALPPDTRYRLVGVGLSNLEPAEAWPRQLELFPNDRVIR